MLAELKIAWVKREFQRNVLDIEIRRLGHGCPFDPIARCNLKPGDNCAMISCPVWLSVGDKVD